MKKIVALAVFTIGFFHFTFAQKFSEGEIRFGVQASPTISWLQNEENTINGNGSSLGLKLGVIGEFYFHERYALMSGINFAFNHGGTLHYDEAGEWWDRSEKNGHTGLEPHSDLEYQIQYVEIPFGLKLKTKDFGHLRIYMELPVFTLGINTQARGTIESIGVDKTDIKKEVNSLNLAWGVGAGIEYDVSSSTVLMFGLGYQQYFTDITDDNNTDRSKAQMHNGIVRLALFF